MRGENCNSGGYAAFLCKYSESRFKADEHWLPLKTAKPKTDLPL